VATPDAVMVVLDVFTPVAEVMGIDMIENIPD